MLYLFKQNSKILGLFDDFIVFRKKTFYHILNFLVKKEIFLSKEEAKNTMKFQFIDFYSKKSKILSKDNYVWEYEEFKKNDIIKEEKNEKNDIIKEEKNEKNGESELKIKENENNKKDETYEMNSKYTKINVKKISMSFKDLNKPLSYLKLSPLYNK